MYEKRGFHVYENNCHVSTVTVVFYCLNRKTSTFETIVLYSFVFYFNLHAPDYTLFPFPHQTIYFSLKPSQTFAHTMCYGIQHCKSVQALSCTF